MIETPTTTAGRQCEGLKRDGSPCGAQALPGRAHCWAHSPELAEQRQAAYRQGGHNRANVVRLRALMPPRLVPVFDRLERALEEVHAGTLAPN
jgi:hypothetical protein